jgi:LmbE family N-acetylglucosaminyl deacetylase
VASDSLIESLADNNKLVKNRLWLLAHQDDELMALHLFTESNNNSVVYLTDGVRIGAKFSANLRMQEAIAVWAEIDKDAILIFFGAKHAIRDGTLLETLNATHLKELASVCVERGIEEIVTLHLEGGHQDHDVTSMLAEELSRRLKIRLLTFPAYRALHGRFPLYSVMSMIKSTSMQSVTPRVERLKSAIQSLGVMSRYRSQVRTWIGLGPFVLLKYLFGKPIYFIHHFSNRYSQKLPTKLLYVNRHQHEAIDYENFRKKLTSWTDAI